MSAPKRFLIIYVLIISGFLFRYTRMHIADIDSKCAIQNMCLLYKNWLTMPPMKTQSCKDGRHLHIYMCHYVDTTNHQSLHNTT